MLASVGNEATLDQPGYLYEPKLDGIRALCSKKTRLKFTTRNEIDITTKYPEFDFFTDIRAKECILDGEIVVYDERGHPSFDKWIEREHGSGLAATYVVFDIVYLDGKSLTKTPLHKRKKILEKVVHEGPHLQTMFYTKQGHELWKKVRGIEGVMAKKQNSTYEFDTRTESWLKIKTVRERDCVVVGFTAEKRTLTSLALGAYNDGKLVYVGKVGTGFDEMTMTFLREQLDALIRTEPVVESVKGVIPVDPVLVVQVAFQNVTKNGKLRAPRFVRLRQDKDPLECVL